jgi:hypothetical protein
VTDTEKRLWDALTKIRDATRMVQGFEFRLSTIEAIAMAALDPTGGCLACHHSYAEQNGPWPCSVPGCTCKGFVDDPAAPCLFCGARYDAHPRAECIYGFQVPAVYYCDNERCTWRGYAKPCERRCPACGAQVWKDGTAGRTKPRPPVARRRAPGEAGTVLVGMQQNGEDAARSRAARRSRSKASRRARKAQRRRAR